MIRVISKDKTIFPGFELSSLEDMFLYFKDKKLIGVDTETTGLDAHTNKIISLQLGDEKDQFVIDVGNDDLSILINFFSDKDKIFIFQNAKFDLQFLFQYGIVPHRVYDTFLAEGVLNKGLRFIRKSLDVLAEKYCNVKLDKSIRGLIFKEGLSNRVIKYAADDVKYLPKIYHEQLSLLKQQDLVNSILLENMFVKVLAYIEWSGIFLDKDKWAEKIRQDSILLDNAEKSLNEWIIDNKLNKYIDKQLDLFNSDRMTTINWSSSKQVVELFKDLKLNVLMKDPKTGNYRESVDASIIAPQKDKSTIVPIYLSFKKYEKALSTYGTSFLGQINPMTGRIHTKFTQIMNTGRLSSGGKDRVTKQEHVNLQNIPVIPKYKIPNKIYERECFISEEGNVLINADYSGQEQVVFANWTDDTDLVNFYKSKKGDMHSFIASKIYPDLNNLSLKEIASQHSDKRQIAKSAGFAINYGGNGSTIADNLNLTEDEGEFIYDSYFKAFPGIKMYFKKVKEHALRRGYILFNNITKSKSYIPYFQEFKDLERRVDNRMFWQVYREEKKKESKLFINELKPMVSKYYKSKGIIERSALNYPIQGSAAEITKLAGIYFFKYLQENDLLFKVLFTNVIHDELMVECETSLRFEIAEAVKKCMEMAGHKFCKTVKLKAEPVITKYWTH